MILDKQAALDRIENDQELYDEICEIFRNDAPLIMAQLVEAFNNSDIPVAIRHAHSLKSAAANIGAVDLTETARLTENAFREGNLENINTLISGLERNISCVMQEL